MFFFSIFCRHVVMLHLLKVSDAPSKLTLVFGIMRLLSLQRESCRLAGQLRIASSWIMYAGIAILFRDQIGLCKIYDRQYEGSVVCKNISYLLMQSEWNQVWNFDLIRNLTDLNIYRDKKVLWEFSKLKECSLIGAGHQNSNILLL